MANRSKDKGDRGEREALAMFIDRYPHLLVQDVNPVRELGAGRADDMGDLRVLPQTAIQVKVWANLVRAVREAADGASRQAKNAAADYALGLAPVPRARKEPGSLRWIASAFDWPHGLDDWEPIPTFGTTSAALKHLREGFGGRVPLRLRMVRVRAKGTRTMLLAPVEAWMDCYCATRDLPLEIPLGYVQPWGQVVDDLLEAETVT